MGVALDPARLVVLVANPEELREALERVARIAAVPSPTATRIAAASASAVRSDGRSADATADDDRRGEPHADDAGHRAREDESEAAPDGAHSRPAAPGGLVTAQDPDERDASAAPERAAKSWMPRNDGSR